MRIAMASLLWGHSWFGDARSPRPLLSSIWLPGQVPATLGVSRRVIPKPREMAVGQGYHGGFHKRKVNPGSRGLSDSPKVTGKSEGRPRPALL